MSFVFFDKFVWARNRPDLHQCYYDSDTCCDVCHIMSIVCLVGTWNVTQHYPDYVKGSMLCSIRCYTPFENGCSPYVGIFYKIKNY